jgi:hypothetical protein
LHNTDFFVIVIFSIYHNRIKSWDHYKIYQSSMGMIFWKSIIGLVMIVICCGKRKISPAAMTRDVCSRISGKGIRVWLEVNTNRYLEMNPGRISFRVLPAPDPFCLTAVGLYGGFHPGCFPSWLTLFHRCLKSVSSWTVFWIRGLPKSKVIYITFFNGNMIGRFLPTFS